MLQIILELYMHTAAPRVVDQVQERIIDVKDDEPQVRVTSFQGFSSHVDLPVEANCIVIEPRHAASIGIATAKQSDGCRKAPHWW